MHTCMHATTWMGCLSVHVMPLYNAHVHACHYMDGLSVSAREATLPHLHACHCMNGLSDRHAVPRLPCPPRLPPRTRSLTHSHLTPLHPRSMAVNNFVRVTALVSRVKVKITKTTIARKERTDLRMRRKSTEICPRMEWEPITMTEVSDPAEVS